MAGDTLIFPTAPSVFVTATETDLAVESLRTYFDAFTGSWFDTLADDSQPNRFTPADLTAVTMLSVTVPAGFAIWLLSPTGQSTTTPLLQQVLQHQSIHTEPARSLLTDRESPMVELWNVLQDGASNWPTTSGGNGVGPVIAGKLLAAKRPHLVPIFDEHVADALAYPTGDGTYWERWHNTLGDDTVAAAEGVRDRAAAGHRRGGELSNLSVLRVLDIAIWMRQHGWRSSDSLREGGRYSAPVDRS